MFFFFLQNSSLPATCAANKKLPVDHVTQYTTKTTDYFWVIIENFNYVSSLCTEITFISKQTHQYLKTGCLWDNS